MGMDAVPGNADMLFDCIRVTWVFMIICALFAQLLPACLSSVCTLLPRGDQFLAEWFLAY